MNAPLIETYLRAVRAIADADGIEGDALRPIVCPFDPAVPAECVGIAMIAVALHERQRRGYAAEWDAAQRDVLAAIAFPEGVDGLQGLMASATLPILHLERASANRDDLLTAYAERMGAEVGDAARQPVAYLLSELVANIWDHAETEDGFVLSGVDDGRLVLAVIDAGISIPFSYARRDLMFPDDVAAVRAALSGSSARPQGGRGFGLRTSLAIVTRGWGGALLVASRHATVLQNTARALERDTAPLHWNGTVVAVDVPLPLRTIDLYSYVEG